MSLYPTKKANAAVIVFTTGAAVSVVGFSLLLTSGFIGMQLVNNGESMSERTRVLLGATMVLLDANDIPDYDFKTIPSYMMEEIKEFSKIKASNISSPNELKSITFSQDEVDELFKLSDSQTSAEELRLLRELLTTPTEL